MWQETCGAGASNQTLQAKQLNQGALGGRFQPKMGNFLCVLPVRLHANGVLRTEHA